MQIRYKRRPQTLAVAILLFSSVTCYGGSPSSEATQGSSVVTPAPAVASPLLSGGPGGVPVTPAPPAYTPPPIVIPDKPQQLVLPDVPPQFVYFRELDYYVAVAVPYDLVYIRPNFYIYSNGYWYIASNWGDPWVAVGPKLLPPVLKRFNLVEFRRHRDHYRGVELQPGWGRERR